MEFLEIDRRCLEYELSRVVTVNSETGEKSRWLTFTSRIGAATVETEMAFRHAACFDVDGALLP